MNIENIVALEEVASDLAIGETFNVSKGTKPNFIIHLACRSFTANGNNDDFYIIQKVAI